MNNVRVTYPARSRRVQMNTRIPVELKRLLVASALERDRPLRDETEHLLRLGLEASQRNAVAA